MMSMFSTSPDAEKLLQYKRKQKHFFKSLVIQRDQGSPQITADILMLLLLSEGAISSCFVNVGGLFYMTPFQVTVPSNGADGWHQVAPIGGKKWSITTATCGWKAAKLAKLLSSCLWHQVSPLWRCRLQSCRNHHYPHYCLVHLIQASCKGINDSLSKRADSRLQNSK